MDVFDERILPIDVNADTVNMPSVAEIRNFIGIIFDEESLSPECAIMLVVYIKRVVNYTKLTIDATNWRKVTLSTLILASKVWEDLAVWNVDFLDVFPSLTVAHLAELEKVLLSLLQYRVSLKGGEYANYYFEIRSLAPDDFPLEPLDKEGAKRLETRSQTQEERARERYEKIPRSKSLTELQEGLRSPRAVLN